jgi:hypothetical protein
LVIEINFVDDSFLLILRNLLKKMRSKIPGHRQDGYTFTLLPGNGLENRICQIWCEGTHNDLENRWLESMPSEYIASYKPTSRFFSAECPTVLSPNRRPIGHFA